MTIIYAESRFAEARSTDAPEQLDADGWPTTRVFARSMHGAAGAFAQDAEYASPITYVGPSRAERLTDLLWWAVGVGVLGALVLAVLQLPEVWQQ
jgi:hypothetical protein